MARGAILSSATLVIVLGCACDPGEPGSPEPTGNATSDSSGSSGLPECIEGEIGCPCIGMSLCEEGLMCVDGLCQDAAADSSGSDGASGDTSTDTGEPGGCVGNEDCDVSEICAFEMCTPSELFSWEMSIVYFEPYRCGDGWGSAEIFYRYYQDDGLVLESTTAGCPANWAGIWSAYDPLSDFRVDFWELDFLFDDYFTTVCWPDELGDCGPIPPEVLHDGGFFGYTGDEVALFELILEPVLD